MYLMHVGRENIFEQVGGVGLFMFPPGEPVEMKNDYLARTILDHKGPEGLIEVPVIRDKRGMTFDLETANKLATEALQSGRKAIIERYIKSQREDRIATGKPPLPPSEKVRRIIEEDGIDLASEGINLVGAGFKVANQTAELLTRIEKMEGFIKVQMEQSQLLAEQNKLLKEKLEPKPARGRAE